MDRPHKWTLHPHMKGGTGISAWWCPRCNQCVDSIEDLARLRHCRGAIGRKATAPPIRHRFWRRQNAR